MTMRALRRFRLAALVFGASLSAITAVRADLTMGPVSDPVGDFRAADPTNALAYAGPDNPALDVVSVNVVLTVVNNTFTITQTMAGPISDLVAPNTGALLGSYSWGINHGFSNLNFAELGLPNILFDSVLTLNPNGTGAFRGATAPAGSVTVSGDTLTAVLPVSFLAPPPTPANAMGSLLPDTEWSFNLWPRSAITVAGTPLAFGDAQIADFAPDNVDFLVTTVPGPSSVVTLGLGRRVAAAGFVAAQAADRRTGR